MKKLFVHAIPVLFCACSLTAARAQMDMKDAQIEFGFFGGISIPNLTASGSMNNPLNTGYSSRLGPDFGLVREMHFSKLFSVETKLEYSSQGGKKDGFQAFPTPALAALYFQSQGMQAPPYLYANFKSEIRLNYLKFPLLAKLGWNLDDQGHFRFSVAAGPFLGILLSAHQVTSGGGNVYADPQGQQQFPGGPQSFDSTDNIRSQLHKANFGADGNIGIAYMFGKDKVQKIFLEAGGNYGFINIQKGSDDGKNNTGAATVLLGYTYKLTFKPMHGKMF
ncbi:MAG: porin family protein [Bacteroidota bacterium]|nr:porin family protein [Bacteroidota bacterium]MDP4251221.1 porin family protein [Bacteroidota bacterium]